MSGWMRKDDNWISFWWRNSLFLIPFSLFGWGITKNKRIFVPAYLAFIIANFISFQPLDWDNFKLFAWVAIFWSILVAQFYNWISKKIPFGYIMVAVLLILSSLSGLESLRIPFLSEYILYDIEDQSLAQWINVNTNPQDVFLTEPAFNHPIAGLSGRSIYMGYPGTLWTYGLPYWEREGNVKQVFAGNWESAQKLQPKISYIVISKYQNITSSVPFTLVYQNNKYQIYKL
jgi:hypothetical protein